MDVNYMEMKPNETDGGDTAQTASQPESQGLRHSAPGRGGLGPRSLHHGNTWPGLIRCLVPPRESGVREGFLRQS